jgi:hypothetical protein
MSLVTTIILNDFETGKRIITLIHKSDIEFVKKVWNNRDTILAEMQFHPIFEGRERWCDLDPKHFTMMIMSILNAAANLTDGERTDGDNRVITSLHFLYAALILCLQNRSDSLIELIRINRIADNDITYDYTATFNIFEGLDIKKSEAPKSGLKLVVDNEEKHDN